MDCESCDARIFQYARSVVRNYLKRVEAIMAENSPLVRQRVLFAVEEWYNPVCATKNRIVDHAQPSHSRFVDWSRRPLGDD